MATALTDCIQSVCEKSTEVNAALGDIQSRANSLAVDIQNSGSALQCVVNGGIGTTCNLPQGGTLPSLAEAINNLNACQINTVAGQNFTATAGQTLFVLTSTPPNVYAVEAAVNGAIAIPNVDYTLAGSNLTFVVGLTLGDQLATRSFIP